MAGVEHQHRGCGLQPGDRDLDRFPASQRRQGWAHDLHDGLVEDGGVGEGAVHELAVLHRPHHLGRHQRRFRLHDRHL